MEEFTLPELHKRYGLEPTEVASAIESGRLPALYHRGEWYVHQFHVPAYVHHLLTSRRENS